jgi:hypothetical protein
MGYASSRLRRETLRKLIFIFIAAVFSILSTLHLSAQNGTTSRQGPRITCASADGNRHYCNADTRNGVRMVNQRSVSVCKEGYSWGFTPRAIWVDHGCRADFFAGNVGPGGGPPPPSPSNLVTCSSTNGRRQFCPADTHLGVRLVRVRSGSICRQGTSWGYDQRGIWVTNGCRADFATGR